MTWDVERDGRIVWAGLEVGRAVRVKMEAASAVEGMRNGEETV